MKDQDRAKACQEALKHNPGDRKAFEELAEILRENKVWTKLITLNEKFPQFANWQNLMETLVAEAERETQPEKQSSLLHVAGQICEVKLGRLDDALKCFQKAVKTWPWRAESFDAARRIYRLASNYKMVVKLLKVELGIDNLSAKRRATLWMEMSDLCLNELKSPENAAEFEAKAREIDPEVVEAILARRGTGMTADSEARKAREEEQAKAVE